MENHFYSSILVSGASPRGFLYLGYVSFNAKPFASWGRELTLIADELIWVIVWDLL